MHLLSADEGGKAVLKLNAVDILVAENGKNHYTYDYELMERTSGAELVLRRGQPFYLKLKLNRNYNPETDGVSLIFNVAGNNDFSAFNNIFVFINFLFTK